MKKMFTLLAAVVLILSPGCQKRYGNEKDGLLARDKLSLYLDLIGDPMETVKETLSLTDEQIADTGFRDVSWRLSEPWEIEGEAFTQEILFNADSPHALLAYRYTFEPDSPDEEKIKDLTAEIALKATGLYGKPIPCFNEESSILDNKGHLEPELGSRGWEMWRMTGDEVLRLSVFISAQNQ